MLGINKKLWSFNFGCFIAASFIWLVSFGATAPVPEILSPHPLFIIDYYSGFVTACSAFMLTALAIIVMGKGVKICTSEHTFWLVLPSLSFIALTTISAFELLPAMLYAAVPSLTLVAIAAVFCRLTGLKNGNKGYPLNHKS